MNAEPFDYKPIDLGYGLIKRRVPEGVIYTIKGKQDDYSIIQPDAHIFVRHGVEEADDV